MKSELKPHLVHAINKHEKLPIATNTTDDTCRGNFPTNTIKKKKSIGRRDMNENCRRKFMRPGSTRQDHAGNKKNLHQRIRDIKHIKSNRTWHHSKSVFEN